MLRGPAAPGGAAGQALAGAAASLAGEVQAAPARSSPRGMLASSVPFSSSSMACWAFISASRPAAGIAAAMSDALVRRVARPVVVGPILPAPRPVR